MNPKGTTVNTMMQEGCRYLFPNENQHTPTIPFDKTGTNNKIDTALFNQAQPRLAICLRKHSQLIVILPDS